MRRILLSILAMTNMWAQQPAGFEVVSIKPASQGSVSPKTDNAIFQVGNISLFQLIERAYRLRGFQIVAPDWLLTTKFEVMAKLPEGATAEKIPEMLQTMLSQRFGMVAHRETKEIAALALVAARNGPQLTPVPEHWDTNARGPMMAMTMSRYAAIVSEGFDQPVGGCNGHYG
jgi:uncharacterized protein (TIGR03435 family)